MKTRSLLNVFPFLLLAFRGLTGNANPTPRERGGHAGTPMFIPQRKKLKGYQKEARRSTFNKHRRAA